MKRIERTLLHLVLAVALGGHSGLNAQEESGGSITAPDVVPDPTPPGKIKYINPNVPDVGRPELPGESYQATVPATLDLAERARLAINALTGMINPKSDYELYFLVYHMANPPAMVHCPSDLNTVGKYLEVLPLLRAMCGSDQNLDLEHGLLKVVLKQQGPDGLIYMPASGRPWTLGAKSDPNGGMPGWDAGIEQVGLLGYGPVRTLAAFLIHADKDPSGPWREAARRLAEGLKRTIIVDGDHAYTFKSWTYPGEQVVKPERLPGTNIGILGGMSAWLAKYLVVYDRAVGDPEATAMAEKMMNYNFKGLKYFEADGKFMPDVMTNLAHGGAGAHFHTHGMNIIAALYVAQKTGNKELLDLALTAYEWGAGRESGSEPLLGFFPEVIFDQTAYVTSETCEITDMIIAAMKLSEMGIDKWDDADRWVRNQLAESQLTRIDWLTNGQVDYSEFEVPAQQRAATFKPGEYTTDRVAERTLGGFSGWPSANDWLGQSHPDKLLTIMNCCSGSGARGLYAVWENMLSYHPVSTTPVEQGILRVNLLLNRASKWADIDSYIPYEGRVDIKSKQLLELEVRIPEWVGPGEVTCEVDGQARDLTFDGRYARVGKVGKGETATLRFPISERTEKVEIVGRDYTLIIRGNDVVWVDPPGKYNPIYQRGHTRAGQTLWRKVTRFVSDESHDWW